MARDTVGKAYTRLKGSGYIRSIKGKGFFVSGDKKEVLQVLLILQKFNSHKRMIFEAMR